MLSVVFNFDFVPTLYELRRLCSQGQRVIIVNTTRWKIETFEESPNIFEAKICAISTRNIADCFESGSVKCLQIGRNETRWTTNGTFFKFFCVY